MQPDARLRVLGLLNERAGAAQSYGADVLRDILAAAFARRGVAAELQFVSGTGLHRAAEAAAAKATGGEIDAVVVGGGDGTVSTVAGVLAGTGIPLGVLPLGTLNHFAKDLGIPLDLDAAVAVICAALTHRVDVAEVNGRVFINNSSIGIYPFMVLDRERRRRLHRLSKWSAMALAALKTLRYFPVRRLSVRVAQWTEPCRSPLVFVGNNKYLLTPPALGRRERLDQGVLSLYVAKPQSRLGLIRLALRSLLGLLGDDRDMRTFTAPAADILTRKRRLLVATDGEVTKLRPPLHYVIRPHALRVFVPAPSA
jgi:diacylglycerol kinase family enzyme